MPRLLLFAPCEKIIVDKDTNATTLIQVLESVNINIPVGEESKLPPHVQIPFSWHILALWQVEPHDEGKNYEMRFELEIPKVLRGKIAPLSGDMPIAFEPNKPNYRSVAHILGFPVLPEGKCLLKIFVREQHDGDEWKFVADYPMFVIRPKKV